MIPTHWLIGKDRRADPYCGLQAAVLRMRHSIRKLQNQRRQQNQRIAFEMQSQVQWIASMDITLNADEVFGSTTVKANQAESEELSGSRTRFPCETSITKCVKCTRAKKACDADKKSVNDSCARCARLGATCERPLRPFRNIVCSEQQVFAPVPLIDEGGWQKISNLETSEVYVEILDWESSALIDPE